MAPKSTTLVEKSYLRPQPHHRSYIVQFFVWDTFNRTAPQTTFKHYALLLTNELELF